MTADDLEYLFLDDAVELVRRLKIGPIRDIGLLDSALARPRSSAFGEDAYPTLELKAGALLHSLAGNHPLVDGNKRLAWAATVVFVGLNRHDPSLSEDKAFALVWSVASGELDVPDIAVWLALRPRGA